MEIGSGVKTINVETTNAVVSDAEKKMKVVVMRKLLEVACS